MSRRTFNLVILTIVCKLMTVAKCSKQQVPALMSQLSNVESFSKEKEMNLLDQYSEEAR